MYAYIKISGSLNNILTYNEQKIKKEICNCILAENYLKDLSHLNFNDKIARLEQRSSLNDRSKKKAVHISLNFHPLDVISNEQMAKIARQYMNGMGFEKQPFLVYRHFDTAHPHVHVVSTNILSDGKRMISNPSFYYESLSLTNRLEEEFSLTPRIKNHAISDERYKTQAEKVIYGQPYLMHSINLVLDKVIPHFNCANLEELNAVLKLYNVKADCGNEGTRIRQHKGLVFHALNERGSQVGRSIKASLFNNKPTLRYLEQWFASNEIPNLQNTERLKIAIDWTLYSKAPSWQNFQKALGKEGIHVVISNEKNVGDQKIYFIDMQTKSVFDGLKIDPKYGLAGIKRRCTDESIVEQQETIRQRLRLGL